MPTLHVRNVPEELYQQIRVQAATKNRSLSAEVVVLLQRALIQSEQDQSEVLAGIRRRRFFRPTEAGAPDSLTLLREDRDR